MMQHLQSVHTPQEIAASTAHNIANGLINGNNSSTAIQTTSPASTSHCSPPIAAVMNGAKTEPIQYSVPL